MPVVSSVIASAPLLAYRYGTFTFIFIGLGSCSRATPSTG